MTTSNAKVANNALLILSFDARTADQDIRGRWCRLPAAAAYDRTLSGEGLRVLAILSHLADYKTGIVRNSIDDIARRSTVTARQIKRHLRQLERRGYLRSVMRTRGKTGRHTSSERSLLYPLVPKRQTTRGPVAPVEDELPSDHCQPNGTTAVSLDTSETVGNRTPPDDLAASSLPTGEGSQDAPAGHQMESVTPKSDTHERALDGTAVVSPDDTPLQPSDSQPSFNNPLSSDFGRRSAAPTEDGQGGVQDHVPLAQTSAVVKAVARRHRPQDPDNVQYLIVAQVSLFANGEDAWTFMQNLTEPKRRTLEEKARRGGLPNDELRSAFEDWQRARR